MKSDLEVFIEARDLVAKGWTQGTYARDKAGNAVGPTGSAAACFCASGAILAACAEGVDPRFSLDPHDYVRFLGVRMRIDLRAVGGNIVAFNDVIGRTKDEVLALFDQVIEDLS